MKKIALILIVKFFAYTLFAQQYYFNNFGVKEGLIQSNTTCGLQDKNAYLWLGTEGGLSKFNGINFTNFTKDDGLVESNITTLFEDKKGVIWIGHANGGISYIKSNKVYAFSDTILKHSIANFTEDALGNIWASTLGNGAFQFHPDSNLNALSKYNQYLGKQGLGDYIFQVYNDADNKLYFVTDVGIKSWSESKKTFEFERIDGLPGFQITYILKDIDRNLWIGTYQGGIFKYNETTKSLKKYTTADGLASNWISSIAQTSTKDIWIGTWGGGISKISNEKVTSYKIINGLQDAKIRFLFEDREKNIIIGTNEHGFSIYNGERFTIYNEKTGLNNDQIWAVASYNRKVFVGHNAGVDIIEDNKYRTLSNFNYPVRSLVTYKNKLFIATWGYGVHQYTIDSGKLIEISAINSKISNFVNHLSLMDNQFLWISTIKGILKYNIITGETQSYPGIIGKVELDVASTKPIDKNKLILGTRKNGLIFYDGNHFKPLAEHEISASPTSIEVENDIVYIGTEGTGVFVFQNNKLIDKINIKNNNLSSDFITGVKSRNNNLYITSNKGLSIYNLSTKHIKNYTELDGFTPIECKLNALHFNNDNLFIGTVAGLVNYAPQFDKANNVPAKIVLSQIKLNLNDTILSSGIELPYKYNTLQFNFDAICLTNNLNLKYEIMLEGWDNWHEVENLAINYSNLPEGNYSLKIKATNNDGLWSPQPYIFDFKIHPPFWRTWWFYLLCIAILILSIRTFIKFREKQLQKEKRILARKVKERTEEVVLKSNELEKALNHIQSSIVYAQRIQQAILPSEEYIKNTFPNSFVYFKPRDIVSGDFYWMEKSGDEVLFAAIDCTGHGVPGAFVSMVGHNLLNQSVRKHKLTQPSLILDDLHLEVQRTLQAHDTSSVKDGMDLALCNYNAKTKMLQYAGAHNALYLIRNNELIEYKADRFAIGYKGASEGVLFKNIEIPTQEGDVIYIFSDGFVDQFGGEKGRKYMSKRFKHYLLDHYTLPFDAQKENLDIELNNWMTVGYKQIDDILIWGIRF